jgi:hypothetical protein
LFVAMDREICRVELSRISNYRPRSEKKIGCAWLGLEKARTSAASWLWRWRLSSVLLLPHTVARGKAGQLLGECKGKELPTANQIKNSRGLDSSLTTSFVGSHVVSLQKRLLPIITKSRHTLPILEEESPGILGCFNKASQQKQQPQAPSKQWLNNPPAQHGRHLRRFLTGAKALRWQLAFANIVPGSLK